jgi:hypothetical protein
MEGVPQLFDVRDVGASRGLARIILSDNPLANFLAWFGTCRSLSMFFDLNVPIPALQPSGIPATASQSKKGKAVARQINANAQQLESSFSPAQIAAVENRVELLIHRPS